MELEEKIVCLACARLAYRGEDTALHMRGCPFGTFSRATDEEFAERITRVLNAREAPLAKGFRD